MRVMLGLGLDMLRTASLKFTIRNFEFYWSLRNESGSGIRMLGFRLGLDKFREGGFRVKVMVSIRVRVRVRVSPPRSFMPSGSFFLLPLNRRLHNDFLMSCTAHGLTAWHLRRQAIGLRNLATVACGAVTVRCGAATYI